jgi:hypothetical protein
VEKVKIAEQWIKYIEGIYMKGTDETGCRYFHLKTGAEPTS